MPARANREVDETWQIHWKCPHCDDLSFSIVDAFAHLKVVHSECPSCRVEQLLIAHLLNCTEPEGTCHWYDPRQPAKA